jgi:hypothetical protein
MGTFFGVVVILVLGGYALLGWHLGTKPNTKKDEEGGHW